LKDTDATDRNDGRVADVGHRDQRLL
jgi:hypothetical protein